MEYDIQMLYFLYCLRVRHIYLWKGLLFFAHQFLGRCDCVSNIGVAHYSTHSSCWRFPVCIVIVCSPLIGIRVWPIIIVICSNWCSPTTIIYWISGLISPIIIVGIPSRIVTPSSIIRIRIRILIVPTSLIAIPSILIGIEPCITICPLAII